MQLRLLALSHAAYQFAVEAEEMADGMQGVVACLILHIH